MLGHSAYNLPSANNVFSYLQMGEVVENLLQAALRRTTETKKQHLHLTAAIPIGKWCVRVYLLLAEIFPL